jgi:glycosyltransferase involved in cell wall biosynthesis
MRTVLQERAPLANDRARPVTSLRVEADGKFFRCGDERFPFHGVTYGTFMPRDSDGERFPERDRLTRDLDAIAAAGFTVVRTYTAPPDDLIDLAGDRQLKLLAGVFYPDWRYLVGASRRQARRVAGDARTEVARITRALADRPEVLGLCLGNEVPADVVRWSGTETIARTIADLARTVHEIDDQQLVTYGNYPSAEYLPLDDLDFLTFNVFLERRLDFGRYLTKLQHLAGDRPLVLGEIGLAVTGDNGEARQAEVLDWQLQTALERGVGTCVFSFTDEWWVGDAPVEGWHFGLTRADRSPRPALEVARRWNERTVSDLEFSWPSISVVVCAYNAAATLDECLRHTCALDYPDLEIVVVDDGSTDETAAIARRYIRVRLESIPHGGLSVARNHGFFVARGDVVAYLDSDAYPDPDWPYYLALGFDGPDVAGVGGPNVPPRTDSPGAHQVARAPGGPLHVLLSDDRAEHIPGCNMAFWRERLVELGGFDPVYTAAGDDVDLCWRLLDRGWEISFHPAALVWHHRRAGLRPYLRQQRGYGRSEALVEARHPDRFTATGTARWRGRIYDSAPVPLRGERIYRGLYGGAAYQSVYRSGGYGIDLAHQVGVPLAVLSLATAPLAALRTWLAVPALLAAVFLVALTVVDVVRTRPPRGGGRALRFRFGVAAMTMLQPIARTWGRVRHRDVARRDLPAASDIPGPAKDLGGGVLLLPDPGDRPALAAQIIGELRRNGFRVLPASGWEDYDARVVGSLLVHGELVTSAHPIGSVQMKVRRRFRRGPALTVAAAVCIMSIANLWAGAAAAVATLVVLGVGIRRTGVVLRRIVIRAASA